jgi:hypothetical protein
MNARVALALLFVAAPAFAQDFQLPLPSPNAKASVIAGLTEITIDYSSPAVKGRKIWGGLLKNDEIWRAGANAATKLTVSKDVTIDGKPVPAGTYSLFVIPSAKGPWTFVLNKNPKASTREYKQDQDLLRVTAKPAVIAPRERLIYTFSNFGDDGATLDLEWEKVRLSLPIKLKTDEQTATNIKNMNDGSWRPYNSAARYYLEKKDWDKGLAQVELSLAAHEDWVNLWTKAQLLAGKGKFKEAYPLAEKANTLGQKAEFFFFADDVKKALADWKGK